MPSEASKCSTPYTSDCVGNAKALHAVAAQEARAQAQRILEENPDLKAFLAQPGAVDFLRTIRPYVQRGYSLEAAIKAVRQNWETLLYRVADGLDVEGSRFGPAAQALKTNLADQVWDAVNGVAA